MISTGIAKECFIWCDETLISDNRGPWSLSYRLWWMGQIVWINQPTIWHGSPLPPLNLHMSVDLGPGCAPTCVVIFVCYTDAPKMCKIAKYYFKFSTYILSSYLLLVLPRGEYLGSDQDIGFNLRRNSRVFYRVCMAFDWVWRGFDRVSRDYETVGFWSWGFDSDLAKIYASFFSIVLWVLQRNCVESIRSLEFLSTIDIDTKTLVRCNGYPVPGCLVGFICQLNASTAAFFTPPSSPLPLFL